MTNIPKVVSPEGCRLCQRKFNDHGETFWFMRESYIFDVDKAREFCEGRQVIELEPEDVRFAVSRCEITETHVPHVDTSFPGIIAHAWHTQEDGEVIHGHVLIDGHHRAARALQLGEPYFVRILTEDESRAILIRSPETTKAKEAKKAKATRARKTVRTSAKKSTQPRRAKRAEAIA